MLSFRHASLIAAVAVLVCHLHCVAHHACELGELVAGRTQTLIVPVTYSGGNQGYCDNVSGCICKGAIDSAPVPAVVATASFPAGDFFAAELLSPAVSIAALEPACGGFHPPPPLSGSARRAVLSVFRC